MSPSVLEIRGLRIETQAGVLVHDVDLQLRRGEVCTLVGASGSGKSLSCLGLLDLLPPGLARTQGQLLLDGQPLAASSVRGRLTSLVLQNLRSAFNPVRNMASHAIETLRQRGITSAVARARMAHCLDAVGLADTERVLQSFAFQLSGGMLQRMMIALALMAETPFLLADEPTSDLDALSQARFLDLLMELVQVHGLGVLLVTHDMGVVARCADQVAVMEAGRIVECQPAHELFQRPASATARTLLHAHQVLCRSQP
ncbi:nickel import ATP-binding protein NikD [Pseudomonas alloputida]|uniref:Nickel import ATP-binding protein NikD n=1 Tax=Pseudomonas alloputida TaxID=1940621 RepID=A0AAW7HYR9_9PSED|nr:nickel import ATP-binding protein NikD [Pseudomonas alloputida]MCE0869537.1 nickel import ATP-binding protein NikD [Pseudomonas alloputida]MDM3954234.1 nickel import ATP-binding protein NikD [Pseudomonas alloputida]